MEPELREAEASEELGFFFKRLGELCFSPAASQDHAGPASSLAVAARAGAVFFSDSQGAWQCMGTHALLYDRQQRQLRTCKPLANSTRPAPFLSALAAALQECTRAAPPICCPGCKNGTATSERGRVPPPLLPLTAAVAGPCASFILPTHRLVPYLPHPAGS